ncbi:hypothetical protein AAC387_Pa05g1838 [Persea americana]
MIVGGRDVNGYAPGQNHRLWSRHGTYVLHSNPTSTRKNWIGFWICTSLSLLALSRCCCAHLPLPKRCPTAAARISLSPNAAYCCCAHLSPQTPDLAAAVHISLSLSPRLISPPRRTAALLSSPLAESLSLAPIVELPPSLPLISLSPDLSLPFAELLEIVFGGV